MIYYTVECGFADPSREAEWNDWYSGPKLGDLLAVPDFLSAQRFRALDGERSPYLNITNIKTTDMFTNPAYKSGGGGGFGIWDINLIIDWRRCLFNGPIAMPPVPDDMRLVLLDRNPHEVPDLKIMFHWLDSLNWALETGYGDGAALDSSVPHRGLAILDVQTANTLPKVPGLRIYEPICPQRVSA